MPFLKNLVSKSLNKEILKAVPFRDGFFVACCRRPESYLLKTKGNRIRFRERYLISVFNSLIDMNNKELSVKQSKELIKILKLRFERNMDRHNGMNWEDVQAKLIFSMEKQWSLNEMEETGGEPDVVGYDIKTNEYIFVDCSAESPKERRSLCYDREALESRKEHKPKSSVTDVVTIMGIELLTEDEYRQLQKLGNFDLKTSSWVKTPADIRNLGGAIFCDRRYNTVFTYHNGAESYYAARGFRGSLRV